MPKNKKQSNKLCMETNQHTINNKQEQNGKMKKKMAHKNWKKQTYVSEITMTSKKNTKTPRMPYWASSSKVKQCTRILLQRVQPALGGSQKGSKSMRWKHGFIECL